MQSSPPPEQRFSNRVENYVKFRPGYPDAAMDWLCEETGLGAGSRVADIGSGTGISSELFLRRQCEVFAVEPNLEMRQAAEHQNGGRENFQSVPGSAEVTTLPDRSIDLAVAVQAFHWFNAEKTRAEFHRILKPGGWTALLWNVRRLDSTPFLQGYERLLLKHGTDYQNVRHENIDHGKLADFFGTPLYEKASFPNFQTVTWEGLKGRLLSCSYVPSEGRPGYDGMLCDLEALFQEHEHEGRVVFEYDTEVYLNQRP